MPSPEASGEGGGKAVGDASGPSHKCRILYPQAAAWIRHTGRAQSARLAARDRAENSPPQARAGARHRPFRGRQNPPGWRARREAGRGERHWRMREAYIPMRLSPTLRDAGFRPMCIYAKRPVRGLFCLSRTRSQNLGWIISPNMWDNAFIDKKEAPRPASLEASECQALPAPDIRECRAVPTPGILYSNEYRNSKRRMPDRPTLAGFFHG